MANAGMKGSGISQSLLRSYRRRDPSGAAWLGVTSRSGRVSKRGGTGSVVLQRPDAPPPDAGKKTFSCNELLAYPEDCTFRPPLTKGQGTGLRGHSPDSWVMTPALAFSQDRGPGFDGGAPPWALGQCGLLAWLGDGECARRQSMRWTSRELQSCARLRSSHSAPLNLPAGASGVFLHFSAHAPWNGLCARRVQRPDWREVPRTNNLQ